jgi:hypothetical protein
LILGVRLNEDYLVQQVIVPILAHHKINPQALPAFVGGGIREIINQTGRIAGVPIKSQIKRRRLKAPVPNEITGNRSRAGRNHPGMLEVTPNLACVLNLILLDEEIQEGLDQR